MKFGSLAAILTGAFTLSQAMAFPLAPVNAFQCDQQTSYEQSMQDLFIRVNQIGKVEKRRDLSKMKNQLEAHQFNQDDITRAETCGGIVYCPAADGEKQEYGTAYDLAAPGQVYIPAHILFHQDESGLYTYPKSETALRGCYFLNYAHPRDHIPLEIGSAQIDYIHTIDLAQKTIESFRGDGITIRLAKEIPGCRPFQVDRSNKPLEAGEQVIAIGAPTPDIIPRPSGKEPVGQFCKIRGVNPLEDAATVYYTDCSESAGESGTVTFVRRLVNVNGRRRHEWLAKSIVVATGKAFLNGDDFDPGQGSFTATVGIEGDRLKDVLNEKGNVPLEHMAEALGI